MNITEQENLGMRAICEASEANLVHDSISTYRVYASFTLFLKYCRLHKQLRALEGFVLHQSFARALN